MNRIGLALLSTTSLLALAGCDTVQLDYKAPSSGSAQIFADAKDGYHYFELPRSYIVFTKAAPGVSSTQHKTDPKTPAPDETDVVGGSDGVPVNGGHGHGSTGSTKQQQGKQTGNAGGQGSDSTTTSQLPNWPNQTIGPDTWSASVIPVASGEGLMVKGRVNYWQSTTLGIARYENSDMPSMVSSKAENLIAKRVGQILSVAGDIAATLAVDSTGQADSGLQPFSIKVTGENDTGTVNKDWDWKLVFDNENSFTQAVSYESLKTTNSKGVGYWPVPACRTAVLTLTDKNDKTTKPSYDFHVTVGTPEWVRLEPLNVDGSLTLGSVCSDSGKGTTDADPGTDAFNIADAFAKGIQSLSTKPNDTPPANNK